MAKANETKKEARERIAGRIEKQTARATDAFAALAKARTKADRLAAAQALESAACQLRRALKEEASA